MRFNNNAKSKKIVSIVSIVVLKKLKVGKSLIASVCRKKRKEVYDPTVLKKLKGRELKSRCLKNNLIAGFVEDKGLYVEIKARKPSRLSLVLLFFNIFVDRKK